MSDLPTTTNPARAPTNFPDQILWAEMVAGEQALAQVKRSFEHWLTVSHALHDMQQTAMRLSNSKNPIGIHYNQTYAAIDVQPLLRSLDEHTRSAAVWLWVNRDAVIRWREEMKLNGTEAKSAHPNAVRRAYNHHLANMVTPDKDGEPDKPKQPRQRRVNRTLDEMADLMRAVIEDMQTDTGEKVALMVNALEPRIHEDNYKLGSHEAVNKAVERFLGAHGIRAAKRFHKRLGEVIAAMEAQAKADTAAQPF